MARPVERLPQSGNPPTDNRSREELWKLYDAALREYHLNTTLGLQRQVFYIGLSTTLLGALATFGNRGILVAIAYVVGTAIALLGSKVVAQTHEHYRAARDHFQEVERRLGLDKTGLALSTTPGMVGNTGGRRMRVTTAARLVLWALAALDLVSAVVALWPTK
jgi:hypothetical protein